MRSTPSEEAVSDWEAVTTRVLVSARSSSGIRPALIVARSSSVPLSVAALTSATQSTNVLEPGVAEKVIVETLESVSPSSRPVMSSEMS